MNVKTLIKYWLPPILWGVVIFTFSANPSVTASQTYWADVMVKKLAHITEYAIFLVLIYRALINSKVSKSESLLLALGVCILYAFTDELHQTFTPGRQPALKDVGFDTIGASISALILWRLLPKAPKRLKNLGNSLGLR